MKKQKMPWFKEYKVFGIPKTLEPYPDQPVHHLLDTAAKKYKHRGLLQLNYKMTYPEVKECADRLATALHAMGIQKGERVATLLPTSIQFVIADYAISKAGLVHVATSSLEPLKNLEHKFTQSTPQALICLDEHIELAQELMSLANFKHLILTRLEDYSDHPPERHDDPGIEGALWLTDLIADTPPTPPRLEYDVEKDLEMILFTGGTTGLPKGCMLTHRNIYANVLQGSYGFGQTHKLLKGAISVLIGLPFFHSYGHNIMHSITYLGADQLLVPDARDTRGMIDMVKTHYPVLQFGVPTQFMNMAKEELKGIGILAISGSAPLSAKTQETFEEKSGGGIMEGYGLSEMSPVSHLNTSLLLRLFGGRVPVYLNNKLLQLPGVTPVTNRFLRLLGPKAVGWGFSHGVSLLMSLSRKKSKTKKNKEKRGTTGIPFPDTEVKFLDVNTGAKLSIEDMLAGQRGEMCLKGPQRMLGYWPEPGSGLDEEGFVRTSDVVEIDDRGYFSIVDRTKDMIIVSGYKVYSRELDDILLNHPGVEMAATVGVSDPERERSERVAVYIQANSENRGKLTEKGIQDWLRERVAKYAVPKYVYFIDEMPLTEVQKVDKKELRQIAARQVVNPAEAAGA